jgi:chromosome transmission fidelity protein 4
MVCHFQDDDDDDNENSFSIRKIKKETGFASHDEDSNLSGLEKEGTAAAGGDGASGPAVAAAPPAPVVRVYEAEQQEPFQPGSTPVRFSSRFMTWNATGIVRCFNNEDDNSIEVEFHDSSVHHPIHIPNNHGYTMADLSNDTLVLACEANEDEMTPSRLVCHNLMASDRSKEWSVDMPGKEEILAVCCGQGWLAAATDTRNLRLFTASGLQRGVLSLPGPVVALTGQGDHLLVSVHVGAPVGEGQTLGFAVFNAVGRKHPVPHFRPLPLSPNAALAWLGFSDEGTPCLMDTAGHVRMLSSSYGSMWVPVADTRAMAKSKSDHYFIVGASTADRKIRCIFCKGSRYPQLLPVPSIVLVSMTLPLCEPATEKSMFEEQYLRGELLPVCDGTSESAEDAEREQMEILVRLFALACKSDHDSRAFDICKLMDTATIQVAIKYASKMRKMQLATRLSELACAIQEREEAEELERSESNADMFETENRDYESDDSELIEPTQANPILMAKMKKEAQKSTRVNKEVVNPFKKATSNGQSR